MGIVQRILEQQQKKDAPLTDEGTTPAPTPAPVETPAPKAKPKKVK